MKAYTPRSHYDFDFSMLMTHMRTTQPRPKKSPTLRKIKRSDQKMNHHFFSIRWYLLEKVTWRQSSGFTQTSHGCFYSKKYSFTWSRRWLESVGYNPNSATHNRSWTTWSMIWFVICNLVALKHAFKNRRGKPINKSRICRYYCEDLEKKKERERDYKNKIQGQFEESLHLLTMEEKRGRIFMTLNIGGINDLHSCMSISSLFYFWLWQMLR